MTRQFALSAVIGLASLPAAAGFGNPGFSGELSLMGAYTSSESNFNTDNKTKTGDLDSGGESDSSGLFLPLGQLRYTFGPGSAHQVFAGTSRADVVQGLVALELGYKLSVAPNSSVAISWLPSVMDKETWADPFVTGQERLTTDESGQAFRIQYTNILSTGLGVDIATYDKDIEDEFSGTTAYGAYSSQLDRNGDGFYGKLSARLKPDRVTTILPSIRLNQFDAEGDALSNTRYGAGLTVIRIVQNQSFALTADYASVSFDKENPVFGKTQDNSELGFTFAYEYGDLFGIHTLAFNLLASYSDIDSNIDFYDEKSLFTGAGVSFKF
ncbi:DUF2860 family protein [Vibrio hannami]|uniref:DUF2860 family protein n=1 Tax=Vibrio hannami TaxID=2717094 RepID=UPI00240F4FFC|nr:DUF2860 family protein [Vibrio hannami]MDG3085832.1 DUF2860 family protein [Vibrio hannami]